MAILSGVVEPLTGPHVRVDGGHDVLTVSDDPQRPARWRLWRQDDHGNAFPMARFDDPDLADAACRRYNAQGHHQHYWVEQERPVPEGE